MRLAAEDQTNDDLQRVDDTVRAGRNVAGPYVPHGRCWGNFHTGRDVDCDECLDLLTGIDEDTRQRRREDR